MMAVTAPQYLSSHCSYAGAPYHLSECHAVHVWPVGNRTTMFDLLLNNREGQ
jgi:hypothetical protein